MRIFIILVTYVQALLWLLLFEGQPWATYSSTPERLAFFTVSISLIPLGILLLRYTRWRGKIIFGVFLIFIIAVAVLDGLSYFLSSPTAASDFSPEEADRIRDDLSAGRGVPAPYLLLRQDGDLYIVGKKRGPYKQYLGIRPSRVLDDFEVADKIVPHDFNEYAGLVDPSPEDYYKTRTHDFLSWQYPEYVFLITDLKVSFSAAAYIEDYAAGPRGIYPIFPYLKEFRQDGFIETLSDRYRTYGNIIRYWFETPHYRTDLVDDPYFLLLKGEKEAARKKASRLPAPRRAFILKKLKAE